MNCNKWFEAMKKMQNKPTIQDGPIPYVENELYYVRTYKVNSEGIANYNNTTYLAYKNGQRLGYGFTPKIELWAV